MILAPKQTHPQELPEQIGALVLVNDTIASVDLGLEVENGTLKIVVQGLQIGKTQEPQEELQKKKWKIV